MAYLAEGYPQVYKGEMSVMFNDKTKRRREDNSRHHNRPTPTRNNSNRVLLLIRRGRRGLLTPIPNGSTRRPRAPFRLAQGRATRRGPDAWADRVVVVVVVGIGFEILNLDSRVQPIKRKRGERLQRLNGRGIALFHIRVGIL